MDAFVQVFSVPKFGNTEDEYEDAVAFSLPDQRFAIADGATESSFSDRWAQSLVKESGERGYWRCPAECGYEIRGCS